MLDNQQFNKGKSATKRRWKADHLMPNICKGVWSCTMDVHLQPGEAWVREAAADSLLDFAAGVDQFARIFAQSASPM